MKTANRLFYLGTTGFIAIGASWWLSQRDKDDKPQVAIRDPKFRELEARVRALRSAVAASPKDSALRSTLAEVYRDLGRLDRAAEQLRAIIKLRPKDPEIRLALGNTHVAMKQVRKAESIYREVTRRWPRNAQAWQGMAVALYHQGRYLEAVECGRRAVQMNPSEPNNHYVLGTAALEYATQFPDPMMHSAELNLAGSHLLKLLTVWPNNHDVRYRLGRAYIALRNRKGAIQNLSRALELSPDRADIAIQLARTHIALGNRESARTLVAQNLAKHPTNSDLHELMGELLQTSREPEVVQRALESFRKAMELKPDSPVLQERFGVACLRAGKLEDARITFDRALRLNPNRSFPYQQLAAIYTRMDKPDLATQFAQNATKMVFNERQQRQVESVCGLHPSSVAIHLILADRYRELGLAGSARDEYLLVLRLDVRNKRARDGLDTLARLQSRSAKT